MNRLARAHILIARTTATPQRKKAAQIPIFYGTANAEHCGKVPLFNVRVDAEYRHSHDCWADNPHRDVATTSPPLFELICAGKLRRKYV